MVLAMKSGTYRGNHGRSVAIVNSNRPGRDRERLQATYPALGH